MKIMNKEQFARTSNGTVFHLYDPLDEAIYIKTGYYEHDGKPDMNGAIALCPGLSSDLESYYDGKPSDSTSYYTDCFSTDLALCDFEDDQLFAVFSKAEIARMIYVLSYALSGCEGLCLTDEDNYIVK